MALAFDASVDGGTTSTASTLSWTHTCTGSDRILIVTDNEEADPVTITGVTYNSVAMTLIATSAGVASAGISQLWYLINPASGANTVTVTRTATANRLVGGSSSYTGAKQSGQPDANTTEAVSSVTSNAVTVTTIADNCWTVAGLDTSAGGVTAGAGTTLRQAVTDGSAILDSNAAITPAGSTSLSYNMTSGNTTVVMASIAPAVAAAAGGGNKMSMMGIGS